MIDDRRTAEAVGAAEAAASHVLPAKAWREIQQRASTLGIVAELLAGGHRGPPRRQFDLRRRAGHRARRPAGTVEGERRAACRWPSAGWPRRRKPAAIVDYAIIGLLTLAADRRPAGLLPRPGGDHPGLDHRPDRLNGSSDLGTNDLIDGLRVPDVWFPCPQSGVDLSRRHHQMQLINSFLARLNRDEEGQGLAEYALILALIAIVAIIALIFLGGQVSKILSNGR